MEDLEPHLRGFLGPPESPLQSKRHLNRFISSEQVGLRVSFKGVYTIRQDLTAVFGGLPEPNRACLVDVW